MKKTTKQTDSKAQADKNVVVDAKKQSDLFGSAMKKFGKGDYAGAKEIFEHTAEGPVLAVSESARMYAKICRQRLEQAEVVLKTAEDHYNYGVALINAREISGALKHLQKALSMGDGAHVRYALALASGLDGDMPGAVSNLQRAISMDPSLRSFARSDADFQPLLKDPVIQQVISSEE